MLEKKLSIYDSSQELLQEAIRTLPLSPKYFEITMLSKGIQRTTSIMKNYEKNRYVSECEKNNIIPFTTLNFKYDNEMNLFTPGLIEINFPIKGKNDIQSILKGGKINEIRVSSTNYFNEQAFENFRTQFINELTENGYEIESGSIQLKNHHIYTDSALFLEKNRKIGVGLRIGTQLSEENTNKIIPWFNGLSRKYDSKNLELFI